MQKAGYIPVACFCIPENCWIEHFYMPQVEAQENFLRKYADNQAAEELIANQRHEQQLYYKYKDFLWLCILYRKENLNEEKAVSEWMIILC